MVSGAEDAGLQVNEELVTQAITSRSDRLLYHDELEGNPLWVSLNRAAGYAGKFFRRIKGYDLLHPSIRLFSAKAPEDRPAIPDTCVSWEDQGRYREIEIA